MARAPEGRTGRVREEVRATTTRLLALRRSRADLGSVAAIGVTVLVVCALVSGLVGALPELQRRSLRAAVEALPADQRVVAVASPYDGDDLGHQQPAVEDALAPVLTVAGGTLVRTVITVAHPTSDASATWSFAHVTASRPARRGATSAPVRPAPGPVVEAVEGRIPAGAGSGPVEVAVPSGSSGVGPGTVLRLRSPLDDRPVPARVVGTWRPRDVAADLVPDRGAGVLLVSEEGLARLAGTGTTVRWRGAPDPAALRPGDLGSLAAGAERLDVTVAEAAESTGRTLSLENPLPQTVDRLTGRLSVQRTLLLVPVLMLTLVGGAAATLAAATLGRRRRTGEDLLRARGAGRLAQAGPSAWEALVVCLLAAMAGLVLGRLLPRALGVSDRLTAATVVATTVAGGLCWLMLSLPTSLRAWGPDRGEESGGEKLRRRRATRLVAATLVVLAAGVLGLVSLSRVRAPSDGLDLMAVIAPSLLLIALVAVLVGGLLPGMFRLATSVLRGRGPVLQVASRAVSRQLGEALPLAFVTALVAGGVAFSVVEDRTRELTLVERSRQMAGADVRVVAPPDAVRAGEDAELSELAAIGPVTSVGGLHRELRFVDDLAVELLAADLGEEALTPLVGDPDLLADARGPARDGAVAALVTPGLADRAGLTPGTRFELPVGGVSTALEVTGTVPGLATVDPVREAVLVDRAALPGIGADEWWLAVRDGTEERLAKALAGRPDLARAVLTPAGTHRELAASPETGGTALSRVLRVVAAGTATLGVVALVAVALLRRAERRRWADFLRALGASRTDVGLTLATEHALVTGGGSLMGVLAGTLTAGLAVAASPVTGTPEPVVGVQLGAPGGWLLLVTALLVAVPLLAQRLARDDAREVS